MTAGLTWSLALADDAARQVIDRLTPVVERVQVTGAIRRRAPDIAVVEVLAVPRIARAEQPDLFGSDVPTVTEWSRLDTLLREMEEQGELVRAGERLFWGGLPVTVHTADRQTWGVRLMETTGDEEFVRLMTTDQRKGGYCPGYLVIKDGRVKHKTHAERFDTPEESDLFDLFKRPYVDPRRRTVGANR